MSDPIKVTLSGNSTPLLPGCPNCKYNAAYRCVVCGDDAITRELTSLRARLAEAENSRDIARGVADAFRDTIIRATGNPDAVHGLMILCQSHEKLAEAEARAGRAEEAVRVLAEECEATRALNAIPLDETACPYSGDWGRFVEASERLEAARSATDTNPAARAAVEGAQ